MDCSASDHRAGGLGTFLQTRKLQWARMASEVPVSPCAISKHSQPTELQSYMHLMRHTGEVPEDSPPSTLFIRTVRQGFHQGELFFFDHFGSDCTKRLSLRRLPPLRRSPAMDRDASLRNVQMKRLQDRVNLFAGESPCTLLMSDEGSFTID